MLDQAGQRDGEALLAAARDGDSDAFGALVAMHRVALHAHCYRMLATYHDADDALQEAMVRAWRALPSFEGRKQLAHLAVQDRHQRGARRGRSALAPRAARLVRSIGRGGPSAPLAESTWIEPYPDRQPSGGQMSASPEARYEERESLELAFVVALQALPASVSQGFLR